MEAERAKKVGTAIEQLWGRLESIRANAGWERRLIAASYLHHRDDYAGTKVERRQTFDGSAVEYLSVFHDGFIGYLMPQDDTWCELVPWTTRFDRKGREARMEYADIEALDGVEGLLQYSERLISAAMSEYADTSYYDTVSMVAYDWLVLGTGYMMAIDDARSRKASYEAFDPQEVCIAENGKRQVDVFVRRFLMDARDVVREYPEAKLERLRQQVKAGGGERSDVVMFEAILPEKYLYSSGEVLRCGDGKPFAHLIWCQTEGELVSESGYGRFPVACVRYERTNSATPYGRSLAEKCLDDIIELDDMGRIRQEMMQKNANPPMNVPYSLQGRFSSRPGARNYLGDMSQAPAPMVDRFDYSKLITDIQDKRESLRAALKADLFRNVMGSTDSRKTAYEVSERKNEAMTLLMMSIGSFKRELIDPVLMRTLRILHDNGRLPSIEAVYSEAARKSGKVREARTFESFLEACRVELSSVFVQRVSAYLQYSGLTAGLNLIAAASEVFPEMRFQVDAAKYGRYLLYGTAVPKAVVRSRKEADDAYADYVAELRKANDSQRQVEDSQAEKNRADALQALGAMGMGA